MVYIPIFINTGSAVQKLIMGIHRQHGDCISLLEFIVSKYPKVGKKILLIFGVNIWCITVLEL
jgi:hypothetical protein